MSTPSPTATRYFAPGVLPAGLSQAPPVLPPHLMAPHFYAQYGALKQPATPVIANALPVPGLGPVAGPSPAAAAMPMEALVRDSVELAGKKLVQQAEHLNPTQMQSAINKAVMSTGKVAAGLTKVGIQAIPEFHNPLEKGWLRLVGFFNEFAESAKGVIPPQLYRLFYGVEMAYTALDCLNTRKHALTHQDNLLEAQQKRKVAVGEMLNTLGKQGLATFLIPYVVIENFKKVVEHALENPKLMQKLPAKLAQAVTSKAGKKFIPVLAGLSTIPLLTRYVDPLVFGGCDKFLRPLVGAAPLEQEPR
ncbi:MAG: hypothetical protein VKJ06_09070 [Vampirovibrionales bacterium]|nr:hypothetical protein [Vampirovibrionales bacterium]